MFKKIGLAIAFSPRAEAMLFEAARLKNLINAELLLIHVGDHGETEEQLLDSLLEKAGLSRKEISIIWTSGDPAKSILKVCKTERVDLLVAGALRKENLINYYLGTVARRIMRKAECSVMMLVNPSSQHREMKNIVVNAEDGPYVNESLKVACQLANLSKANWLHIVREIKMYGLTMSISGQYTDEEQVVLRQSLVKSEIENVNQMLCDIPHQDLKINVKVTAGKSGFELAQFARRKHADLLVVSAPPRKYYFFDRMFTHDQEYLFADLPCDLLMVNPKHLGRKEAQGG
ncbi:MAG TPA: universal stress protein [Cyclobacteriaceae bacterium]|nr:universal stress protein [Cyclobacteriaceae bacterium]